MMTRPVHISAEDLLRQMQVTKGDLAETALVSGQMHRVKMYLGLLENAKETFDAFGYTFWTGTYQGKRITIGNGGLYAPDTALLTELLCAGGVNLLVRLGSCGALRQDIQIGDVVIADSVVRGDGVTSYYVSSDFLPTATKDISDCFFACLSSGMKVHRGMIWTTDALLKETPQIVNPIIKKGAIAVDMVTSPFFTIASMYQRRHAACLAVSDNLITGEMGFGSPALLDVEQKMIAKTLEMILSLQA
jgi:uridine phosphorylase